MNDSNANAISSLEDTENILSQMWTEAHEEINNIDPGEFKLK
jgi:phage shock protein A